MLPEADLPFYESEFERLRQELEEAFGASALPDAQSGRAALNDLLVRVRCGFIG